MIVFGDVTRAEVTRTKLGRLSETLRVLPCLPPGLGRHAAAVTALIEAGDIAIGAADSVLAARGHDDVSPAADATLALLSAVARGVRASWESGFARAVPAPEAEIAAAEAADLPDSLRTKRMEGFCHYALYPEAYLRAAAALAGRAPRFRVIGVRGIGAPLGAVVAAALGAPAPVTLRPVGHPFRREVAASDALAAAIRADPAAHHAIVDEGPGLSGSTFAAVARFLGKWGSPTRRIHLLPGHPGPPGPRASEEDRGLWDRLPRHPALFDDPLLVSPRGEHRLETWAGDLLGPPVAPMEDLSGGAWRRHRYGDPAAWPPIHPHAERRKFLFRTAEGPWLLKFVGLGRHGEEASDRARALAAAGFAPEVAGLLHGFLAQRWIADAGPPDLGASARPRLIAHLARYLGFRARRFPAGEGDGATAEALWEMARHNAWEALGEPVAARLDRRDPSGASGRMRRVFTDNRLHAPEWLRRPDGTLLKADAVDHAVGHDLVGCQDIAWDVVGAAVEFGFAPADRDRLARAVEAEAGAAVDPALIAFLTPCYLAFQLGHSRMAAEALGDWAEERARAEAAAASYAARLRRELTGAA